MRNAAPRSNFGLNAIFQPNSTVAKNAKAPKLRTKLCLHKSAKESAKKAITLQ